VNLLEIYRTLLQSPRGEQRTWTQMTMMGLGGKQIVFAGNRNVAETHETRKLLQRKKETGVAAAAIVSYSFDRSAA
jgi:hypothetical protein